METTMACYTAGPSTRSQDRPRAPCCPFCGAEFIALAALLRCPKCSFVMCDGCEARGNTNEDS
jgi:hypothetical protein